MSAITTELILIGLLLVLNGVLAMSEIAIVSARKARLRQSADQGDRGAAAALALAAEPTRFLSTVQIGITLVGIFAGAFGGATIAEQLGESLATIPELAPYADAIGLGVVVALVTFLSLIVGELVPKRLALNSPERIAALVARPMRLLATLAGPLVALLTLTTDGILRVLGVRPTSDAAITEEEVRLLIAQGTEAGVFEASERELVESAFELSETQVLELMRPRPLITWLNLDAPPDAAWALIANAPHSYYPVCRGELDRVVGVLALKDVARRLLVGEPIELTALVRPPLFLPEHLAASHALEQFKQGGSGVALVIDEHGGIAGLLTPTDVLEALVGDLAPATADDRTGPVRREDGTWLLDGLMRIDDAVELLGVKGYEEDETDDMQTVGGLAMATLGRIPAAGDRFVWHDQTFEILDMDGRRVDKLLALGQPVPSFDDEVANDGPTR
jgi:putative hemolysin